MILASTPPLSLHHAGVVARHGYRPPRYLVARLAQDDAAGWAAIAPVPAISTLDGSALSPRAVLRLAYDDVAFYLNAQVGEPAVTVRPADGPGTAHFWRQDHIEWRWLPDPQQDQLQVQLIIAADGRWWDNQGWWQQTSTDACCGAVSASGWQARLKLPWTMLGRAAPVVGAVWRGLLAHTRWADDAADLVASGAVELGFNQAERCGEWEFVGAAPALALAGVTASTVTLMNRAAIPASGALLLTSDHDDGDHVVPGMRHPVTLPPGLHELPLPLPLTWPRFRRWHFSWCADASGERHELGAVTLRAPWPALRLPTPRSAVKSLRHPYLLFNDAELSGLRAKAQLPYFARVLAELPGVGGDPTGADLPAPDEAVSLAFTPACANWFRVAKETMVRDGAGQRQPAAARLWALQSPAAHAAWRAIVAAVTPPADALATVLAELNALLERRDLYDPVAFAAVHLPAEGAALVARGVATLPVPALIRCNRLLLQSSIECVLPFRMDLAARPARCWEQWLATGDARLIATATRAVQAALTRTIPGPDMHLHEGMAASGLALAYDAFHPHLTPAERRAWEALLTRFLQLYLHTAQTRAWAVTTIANANPVDNAGGGLLALALLPVHPRLARTALEHARRNVWRWLDYCASPDGANTEGAQYWQYGMDNFLRFATACERVTGSDDGLLTHPAVQHTLNMVRVGLCNDGALHGVNDTVPMPVGGGIAWWVAGRTGDALALWYGDHAHRWLMARRDAGRPVAYGAGAAELLLYRPALAEQLVQPVPLPTAFALAGNETSIVRSSPAWNARWTAGLTGARPPFTHHHQPDTGSLWADLRGERLLLDPGYYLDAVTDHCLPLVDGHGPAHSPAHTGTIITCRSDGERHYVAVDATAAYAPHAQRVVRHLLLLGDEALVLLDEVVADAAITAQFQCGGVTSWDATARTLLVAGTTARLQLTWPAHPELVPQLHAERSLHATHWGYHFADCRWFPVTCSYPALATRPLLTVATDHDAGAVIQCEQRHHAYWLRLPSGREQGFVQGTHGWQVIW